MKDSWQGVQGGIGFDCMTLLYKNKFRLVDDGVFSQGHTGKTPNPNGDLVDDRYYIAAKFSNAQLGELTVVVQNWPHTAHTAIHLARQGDAYARAPERGHFGDNDPRYTKYVEWEEDITKQVKEHYTEYLKPLVDEANLVLISGDFNSNQLEIENVLNTKFPHDREFKISPDVRSCCWDTKNNAFPIGESKDGAKNGEYFGAYFDHVGVIYNGEEYTVDKIDPPLAPEVDGIVVIPTNNFPGFPTNGFTHPNNIDRAASPEHLPIIATIVIIKTVKQVVRRFWHVI